MVRRAGMALTLLADSLEDAVAINSLSATRIKLDGFGQALGEFSRYHEPSLVGVSCCLSSIPKVEL